MQQFLLRKLVRLSSIALLILASCSNQSTGTCGRGSIKWESAVSSASDKINEITNFDCGSDLTLKSSQD